MNKKNQFLSKSEKVSFSTIRLECVDKNGNKSIGTGFLYEFYRGVTKTNKSLTVIVTNKHVVENSVSGIFNVTCADESGLPRLGWIQPVPLPPVTKWIYHPDPDIDLAILPIGPFIGLAWEKGIHPYIATFADSDLPTETDLELVAAIDEIVMPGYPIGLWDKKNNLPIFRKGVLATNPSVPFNGKEEFLIDISIFPGSSGSPVLLMNIGDWVDKWGNRHSGNRIKLLGIAYAGFEQSVKGSFVEIPLPTAHETLPITNLPINLGLVISSSKLKDFERLLPTPEQAGV